ncbi:MAG: NAD(P)H-binding protein [Candidatus Kapabacteria bacterium]|jgi:putative NADH-flavin reductase|nr:NAD(P)H-binding protein [Candidatus Kapabacteria bacterium]
MKTLTIFGASGATGQILVAEALRQGFAVTVLCRQKTSMTLKHEHLLVVEGAITPENCRTVIEGSHAVLCALGQRRGDSKPFCADATQTILQAMETVGVKRFVCLTGAMVGERNAVHRSWFIRTMVESFRKRMPEMAADRALQEDRIAASATQWTVVKPPRLSNGAARGKYHVGETVRVTAFSAISRADLAAYLLQILDDPSTFGKFLVIKG